MNFLLFFDINSTLKFYNYFKPHLLCTLILFLRFFFKFFFVVYHDLDKYQYCLMQNFFLNIFSFILYWLYFFKHFIAKYLTATAKTKKRNIKNTNQSNLSYLGDFSFFLLCINSNSIVCLLS